MSKIFLICFVLFCFGFLGIFILFNINALPEPMMQAIYQLEDTFHIGNASLPYLEKFEGKWNVALNYTGDTTETLCHPREGTVTVHNGMVSGVVGIFGNTTSVQGTVSEKGEVVTRLGASSSGGSMSGAIEGTGGAGTWQDEFDCKGSVTFSKIDPLIDPTMGKIVSFTGNVVIIRATSAQEPYLDQSLYAGDKVQVPTGGSATVVSGTGFEKTIIPAGTTYTVGSASN